MSNSKSGAGERVKDVHLSKDTIGVDLIDGRTVTGPLARYPRLLHDPPEQRTNLRMSGGGNGIHRPDPDEDLSMQGLPRGAPAPRVSRSLAAWWEKSMVGSGQQDTELDRGRVGRLRVGSVFGHTQLSRTTI